MNIEIIYPTVAIATLILALAIVLLSKDLRVQTGVFMIASTSVYLAIAQSGDIQLAALVLVTGILGALAMDNFSLNPKVRYAEVMV